MSNEPLPSGARYRRGTQHQLHRNLVGPTVGHVTVRISTSNISGWRGLRQRGARLPARTWMRMARDGAILLSLCVAAWRAG